MSGRGRVHRQGGPADRGAVRGVRPGRGAAGLRVLRKALVAADGEMWGLKMAYYAATGFRRAEASRHGRGLHNPAHRPPRAL